jgi:SAM-dependent methyltransferase
MPHRGRALRSAARVPSARVTPEHSATQDPAAAKKNETFFADNADYARKVATMATYKNIRSAIDREITGVGTIVDIGNGGVFDYDTSLAGAIVAVDLMDQPETQLPANCEYRRGSALQLPESDGRHDAALMVMLFHHLTGAAASDLPINVAAALREAARVVRPGGRLIVVESCVPRWFYSAEQILFAPLRLIAGTRLLDHPPTLQLTSDLLRTLVSEAFSVDRLEPIPTGPWLMQFGRRWPTALTPARPYLLTATKR